LDDLLSARSSILHSNAAALSSNDIRLCDISQVRIGFQDASKRIQQKIAKTFEDVHKNLQKNSSNNQSLLSFTNADHKSVLDAAFRQWIAATMDKGIDIIQQQHTAASLSSSTSSSSSFSLSSLSSSSDVMEIDSSSFSSSWSPVSSFPLTVYFHLLEISMWALSEDFVETTPFGLFEEFFERLSTFSPLIPSAFSFLSSRRSELTSLGNPPFPQKSKLTLLRTCNGLLKRLSKTTHSALSGEILLLISAAFPIDDKSGLNITGRFHTANVTAIDDDNEAKSLLPAKATKKKTEEKTSKDAASQQQQQASSSVDEWLDTRCYRSLWSLQNFFSNPQPLRERDNKSTAQMTNFTSTLEFVLSAFEAIRLSAISDSTSSSAASAASSHRQNTEQLISEYQSSPFFPKYLTSSRLLHLQLRDAAFRRHVLTQALLILDFLLNPTGESISEREKEQKERETKEREKDPKLQHHSAELKEANRALRRSALAASSSLSASSSSSSAPSLVAALYPWTLGQPSASCTLTAVQQNTLKNLWNRVLKNVRATPGFPAGPLFCDALLGIVNRDRMWTKWKADKCPPFELPITVDLQTPIQLSKKSDGEKESKKDDRLRHKRNLDELMGLVPAVSAGATDGRSRPPLMGSPDLMRLWSNYHTSNEGLKAFLTDPSRKFVPPVDEFLRRAVEEEKDTTFAPDEDDKVKNDPRFVFRGLRLLALDADPKSFSAFLNSGSMKRLVEIRAGTRTSEKEGNDDQQDAAEEQKKLKDSAAAASASDSPTTSTSPPAAAHAPPAHAHAAVTPLRMKEESKGPTTTASGTSSTSGTRNSSTNSDDMDIEKKAEKAESKVNQKTEPMSS
jgi:hypothetical protein